MQVVNDWGVYKRSVLRIRQSASDINVVSVAAVLVSARQLCRMILGPFRRFDEYKKVKALTKHKMSL